MSVNELVSPQVTGRRDSSRADGGKALPRYAAVMVHAGGDSPAADGRIALAIDIARRFGASLVGVAGEALQPPPVDPFGGGVMVGEIIDAEEERVQSNLQAARTRFETLLRTAGLETEWRSSIASPTQIIAQGARSADLVVIGREPTRSGLEAQQCPDPGDLLMHAGRPLLVVPPGGNRLLAERIVLAWKDTREARRALWDALPFLTRAAAVHVVEVAAENELQAAAARVDDVARHLTRHGVAAKGEAHRRREAKVADELILVAEQNDADLIVAGGYGHARLREWVFGGVTADLLRHSPKCCLLSH
ncbi:MAG TPA: universal stress protein [Beijerinckiaceae bacterium]|nr:universal stress protein [Beijerinckiaceae bacterium]